jgi:hypothetical protein
MEWPQIFNVFPEQEADGESTLSLKICFSGIFWEGFILEQIAETNWTDSPALQLPPAPI